MNLPLTPSLPAIELSPAAGPHWQALNLNPNRNLARLRFLEIKSKITIKIGKKPFRLNSMAVLPAPLPSPHSFVVGRGKYFRLTYGGGVKKTPLAGGASIFLLPPPSARRTVSS